MDYVRAHIKKYASIAFRRTLGLGFVILCVLLAMAVTFASLTSTLAISNFYDFLVFWLILVGISLIVFLTTTVRAHTHVIRYMNEEEHAQHSKYVGLWLIAVVLGVVLFLIPLLFSSSYIEPITLLFSFGGICLILFFTVMVIFKHKFGELAIGGAAFWVMCLIGVLELNGTVLSTSTKTFFSLYLAAMALSIICGVIGVTMIINSSRESLNEAMLIMEDMDRARSRQRASRRKR